MAKRYSKLPTELLPKGTIPEYHALAFNLNIALISAIAEYRARSSEMAEKKISDRPTAMAAISEARADLAEWRRLEAERNAAQLN